MDKHQAKTNIEHGIKKLKRTLRKRVYRGEGESCNVFAYLSEVVEQKTGIKRTPQHLNMILRFKSNCPQGKIIKCILDELSIYSDDLMAVFEEGV